MYYGCNGLNDLSQFSFEALINLTDVVGYLLKQIIDYYTWLGLVYFYKIKLIGRDSWMKSCKKEKRCQICNKKAWQLCKRKWDKLVLALWNKSTAIKKIKLENNCTFISK